MQNDEIDFRPFFKAVGKFKGLVLLWVVIGAIVALVITFVIPAKWKCQADLLLPLQSSGASALAGILSDKADPLEMMKGVLLTRATEEYLAKRSNVEIKDIDKSLNVQTQKDQNQVVISFTDQSKTLAAEVVNNAIARLEEQSEKGNLSLAVKQAASLNLDLEKRNANLNRLEKKLVDFLKTCKTPVDPTNPFASDYSAKAKESEYEVGLVRQEKAAALTKANQMGEKGLLVPTPIPNQEQLRERLVSQQYQLKTLQTTLGEANPQVRQMKEQVELTKNLLSSEIKKYLDAAQNGVDPMMSQLDVQEKTLEYQNDVLGKLAKAAPDEALKASKMYQEITVELDAYKVARGEYEQAKLGGLVDPLQWSILSAPYFEDKPENKRYGLFSFLGCLCGLLVGALAANLKESKVRKREAELASRP
jgi:uncharacterized protein involved in exopolysaccharide biosynthesis